MTDLRRSPQIVPYPLILGASAHYRMYLEPPWPGSLPVSSSNTSGGRRWQPDSGNILIRIHCPKIHRQRTFHFLNPDWNSHLRKPSQTWARVGSSAVPHHNPVFTRSKIRGHREHLLRREPPLQYWDICLPHLQNFLGTDTSPNNTNCAMPTSVDRWPMVSPVWIWSLPWRPPEIWPFMEQRDKLQTGLKRPSMN